jgi:hypothetical protein
MVLKVRDASQEEIVAALEELEDAQIVDVREI